MMFFMAVQSLSIAELILRWLEGVPGKPRKRRKEGQEDQGEIKEFGNPITVLRSPGPPGLRPGTPGDPLELPQANLS